MPKPATAPEPITGRIPVPELAGDVDLSATIESGQTYGWWRADGTDYGAVPSDRDPGPWYETVLHPEDPPVGVDRAELATWVQRPTVVGVRRAADEVQWRASAGAEPAAVDSTVRRLLRLDDDLPALQWEAPDDPVIREAIGRFPGLRLVREPPFRCLISFICSTQMRVARIHRMQRRLARTFGEPIAWRGDTVHAFPTPESLAEASEDALRDCGLGYRAPYVRATARMVADGEAHPAAAAKRSYPKSREWLTRFDGVGPKVADCVLLFALDELAAVPLDTWIQTAIGDHFPDCDRDSYAETSVAIRERLGGEIAGYVQTVLFHHLRTAE
jgi:N-glycosylase/DNA lyase